MHIAFTDLAMMFIFCGKHPIPNIGSLWPHAVLKNSMFTIK